MGNNFDRLAATWTSRQRTYEGATWETNWTAEFTRTGRSAEP